jgi:predicted metal-binding membrane protein
VPSWFEPRERALPRETNVAAALLVAALVAWIVTYRRMRGMDAGPGTDLGGLGWYVGVWVTMTAAMMLPSVVPTVSVYARVEDERRAGRIGTAAFVAGYLIVWTAYGLLAYGAYRVAKEAAPSFLSWGHAGRYVAAGALVVAGLYELTPLKQLCLRHCRAPLHFVLGGWRNGRSGAMRMGLDHGRYCVGCCSGLMVALFALGVMSLTWMAAVALIILVQKVLPYGERFALVSAVAFVVLGIWVAAAPGSVPGLHLPGAPTVRMG